MRPRYGRRSSSSRACTTRAPAFCCGVFARATRRFPGFLDDYAFLIAALLDLYEASFDAGCLERATQLAGRMLQKFEDPSSGGFFTTEAGDTSLVLRMKDDYDGAEPSGNSIAWLVLLRLAHLTDRPLYREAAQRTQAALVPKIAAQPVAVPQMLVALDYSLATRREVVLAGKADEFLQELRGRFLPHTVVLQFGSEQERRQLEPFFAAAAGMHAIGGKPTAYVCRNHACDLPVNEVSKFVELLQ